MQGVKASTCAYFGDTDVAICSHCSCNYIMGDIGTVTWSVFPSVVQSIASCFSVAVYRTQTCLLCVIEAVKVHNYPCELAEPVLSMQATMLCKCRAFTTCLLDQHNCEQ